MTATAPRRTREPALSGSPVLTYYLLAVASIILVIVGLAVVLSSTANTSINQTDGNPYALFLMQLMALALGVAAMMIGSRLPVLVWKRATPWILFGSIGLLVAVILFGRSVQGNQNWVYIGSVSIQPSEIAKLGLALYLGVVLSTFRTEMTSLKRIMVPGGLMALAVIGLVLAGRDMGTALVFALIVSAAYWVAGLPLRYVGVMLAGALVAAIVLIDQQGTRGSRIDVWLNPENCDPLASCMQTQHGTWALASGGLWGLGPGMSREKWGYLPAADNDFIFSIVGEEFGLVGTLLLLVAYGMIMIAVNRLVQRHPDPFVQISAAAIGAWIVGQAIINIAMVVGFAPVIGVPLPLVSSGGSSLIMSLTAIGVLMAFARREPGAHEAFSARPGVVRRSVAVISRGRRG